MKKLYYYISLVVLFIACMIVVSFIMAGIEQILSIRLGGMLMNVGFFAGIGLFFLLKPAVKRLFNRYDLK